MTDQLPRDNDGPASATLPAYFSARHALGSRTILALLLLVSTVVGLVITFPYYAPPVLTLIGAFLYLISTIDRNMLMLKGIGSSSMVSVNDAEAKELHDALAGVVAPV